MNHDFVRVPATYDADNRALWRCVKCGEEARSHGDPEQSFGTSTCPAVKPVAKPPDGIETVLAERGSRYGSFLRHADITQRIKSAMRDSPNWESLCHDQRECLEMVAHKIGRILNGDPNYADSWVDIEGYVHLVTKRLTTGETP